MSQTGAEREHWWNMAEKGGTDERCRLELTCAIIIKATGVRRGGVGRSLNFES